jgi:hypothetical protein
MVAKAENGHVNI